MRKETDFYDQKPEDEDDDTGETYTGDWTDDYPSETVHAVPITDTAAGVTVTRYDLDDADMPVMFEIAENYPPEDDVENDAVYFHGEGAAAAVIGALSELLENRMDPVDWDDVLGDGGRDER